MGIAIPGKTVFLIETAPWCVADPPHKAMENPEKSQLSIWLQNYQTSCLPALAHDGPYIILL